MDELFIRTLTMSNGELRYPRGIPRPLGAQDGAKGVLIRPVVGGPLPPDLPGFFFFGPEYVQRETFRHDCRAARRRNCPRIRPG